MLSFGISGLNPKVSTMVNKPVDVKLSSLYVDIDNDSHVVVNEDNNILWLGRNRLYSFRSRYWCCRLYDKRCLAGGSSIIDFSNVDLSILIESFLIGIIQGLIMGGLFAILNVSIMMNC